MEWVIVDDGTDPVESLVKNVEGVKYKRPTGEKMKLGAKRNYMHKFCKGDAGAFSSSCRKWRYSPIVSW